MSNSSLEPLFVSHPQLDLHLHGTMERLARLVTLDAFELVGFDDPIAEQMPPTWRCLLTLGTKCSEDRPLHGASFRVAEPFSSPASLIRGEVDLLWNWYLKQELPFDVVAGQTGAIVNSLYMRPVTGTICDWLPACLSHLLPNPRRTFSDGF